MPRIKELEDILVLVDAMPRERQMQCVESMLWQVEYWEERIRTAQSFLAPSTPLPSRTCRH